MNKLSGLSFVLAIAACGPNATNPDPCEVNATLPECQPVDPCIADPSLPQCDPGSTDPVAGELEIFVADNNALSGGLIVNDAELDAYLPTEDAYYDSASEIGACNDLGLPPFFQNTIANNAAGGVHVSDGTSTIDLTQDQDGFYELLAPAGTFAPGSSLDLDIDGSAEVDAALFPDLFDVPAGPLVVNGSIDGNGNVQLTDTLSFQPIPGTGHRMRVSFSIFENNQPKTISCGIDPAVGTVDISAVRPRLGGGGSFFVEVRDNARVGLVLASGNRSLAVRTIQGKSQGFINPP